MQKTQMTTQTRQTLKISPGVQLALKFLQLPALELQSWLSHEILQNPLLELEDGCEEEEIPSDEEAEPEWEPASDGLPGSDDEFFDTPALPRGLEEMTVLPHEDRSVWRPSARDRLREQLHLVIRDPRELEVADYWLGCLDDRGYVGATAAEVAADLGVEFRLAQSAWDHLRDLDPPGVGAVDLRDCLCLQLLRQGKEGSPLWTLVSSHFDDLAHARYSLLRRRLGVDQAGLEALLEDVRALSPRPLRGWEGDAPHEIVIPDLLVTRIGSRFEVLPVDRSLPRLRLSRSYDTWVGGRRGRSTDSSEADVYLGERLRAARWILQSLDRRRDTMVRVMRAILEEQLDFFRYGPARLGPLNLQTIARKVGLHESTVARVTQSKYVQTPVGVVSLKSFFSSRIVTRRGEPTSGRAVREKIRMLIAREDREQPLTDEQIATILAKEGIPVARRTVAKYRDRMQIDRARLRRRVSVEAEMSPQSETEVRLRWASSEQGSPEPRRKRIA